MTLLSNVRQISRHLRDIFSLSIKFMLLFAMSAFPGLVSGKNQIISSGNDCTHSYLSNVTHLLASYSHILGIMAFCIFPIQKKVKKVAHNYRLAKLELLIFNI